MKKKTKVVVAVLAAIVVILGSIGGYFVVQNHIKEEKIEKAIAIIDSEYKEFDKETDRSKKLKLYEDLSKESSKYNKSEAHYKEVEKKYDSTLAAMKEYFTDEYDKTIADSSVEDLKTVSKGDLNSKIKTLKELSKTIDSEKDIVCTDDEYKKYDDKIKELIESYSNQVTIIERKEEYDGVIAQCAEKNIEELTDKNTLNTMITGLNNLTETIKNEGLCTEDEINDYQARITELLNKCNDRLTAIENEEAEKKRQEEAKAEKEKKKKEENSSNNSSSASNSSSGGSSSSSSASTQDLSPLTITVNGQTAYSPYFITYGNKVLGHECYWVKSERDGQLTVMWEDCVTHECAECALDGTILEHY